MTGRILVRALMCFALVAAMAPSAAARHKPPLRPAAPLHNFVNLDLTESAPAPLEQAPWARVQLLDTDGAIRTGDVASFDVLEIAQNFQGTLDPATRKVSYRRWWPTRLEHYRAACGWRTIQMHGFEPTGDQTNVQWSMDRALLIDMRSPFRAAVDAICAGKLPMLKGAPSTDAATTAWKDMFAAPGQFMNYVTGPHRARPLPAWTGADHRFVAVSHDPASGNFLLLDTASLAHDGNGVTGLSFEILGPDAQDASATALGATVERQVRYDCAARTMTVLSEAYWNAVGEFLGADDGLNLPRGSAQSTVAADEIKSACEGAPTDVFATGRIQDAWQAARQQWATH